MLKRSIPGNRESIESRIVKVAGTLRRAVRQHLERTAHGECLLLSESFRDEVNHKKWPSLHSLFLSAFVFAAIGLPGCSERAAQPTGKADPAVEQDTTAPELPPGQSLAGTEPEEIENSNEDQQSEEVVAVAPIPGDIPTEMPAETVARESTGSDASVIPEPATSVSSPENASSIVDRLVEFYAGLESIRVKSELSSRVVDERGRAIPNTAAPAQIRELTIQRPDRFLMRPEAVSFPVVVSDGDRLSAYLTTTSRYLNAESPPMHELITDAVLQRLISTSPTQMIPFQLMMGDAGPVPEFRDAEFVSRETIDGVPADRLTFSPEQGFVWHMWVAAEGDPLLLQVSANRGGRKVPVQGRGETEITVVMYEKLYDWELNLALTGEDFVIEIPASAVEAEDISGLFDEGSSGE